MKDNVFFFLKFKNDIHFLYETMSLRQGLDMMKAHSYTAVPVIDSYGRYKGSVSEGDFLWYLLDHKNETGLLEDKIIQDLLKPQFMPAVNINIAFDKLLESSLHQNYVPVVDDRNIFIGIVTRQTLLNYLIDIQQTSQAGLHLLPETLKTSPSAEGGF